MAERNNGPRLEKLIDLAQQPGITAEEVYRIADTPESAVMAENSVKLVEGGKRVCLVFANFRSRLNQAREGLMSFDTIRLMGLFVVVLRYVAEFGRLIDA